MPGALELQGFGYPGYFFESRGGWGAPEDDGVRHVGIYKKEVPVTREGEYYIVFDSFKDYLTLYINGEKAGESKNGAIGAAFKVKLKTENEIVIVVGRDKSGINKEDNFALSGILGEVYITETEPYGKSAVPKERGNVVLKGVKYTPTHPESGDAISNAQAKKDVALIKEYGFNAVWTSCAPEEFYEEAQKAGLYIVDEANVNLDGYDRNKEAAKARCEEMVKRHGKFENIIMWSAGWGDDSRAGELTEYLDSLDSRVVAQKSALAEEFTVFGNTGGMEEWVNNLGNGNIGGFVDEFADKELYYRKHVYLFDTNDAVTGETVEIDGEVKTYKGTGALGNAGYERNIANLDKYTIVTNLAPLNGDRVLFESGDVKLEIKDYEAVFSAGGKSAKCDISEGMLAAVYEDGELQIFADGRFADNKSAAANIGGSYTVGGGKTPILDIYIYNDALTLDELLEGAEENKLISSMTFEDITVKEDKSYRFLAHGGDFGDSPHSYYKCLTGLFTALRVPRAEAEEFRVLLKGLKKTTRGKAFHHEEVEKAPVEEKDGKLIWEANNVRVTADTEGRITSILDNGSELLTAPIVPTTIRDMTIREIENGEWQEEGFRKLSHEVKDDTLYVTLLSTTSNGKITLAYFTDTMGTIHASIQSVGCDITFLGFKGEGKYKSVSWKGYEESSYPDRVGNVHGRFEKSIKEMSDSYAVIQENGNKNAEIFTLTGSAGQLTFSPEYADLLECRVHNYKVEDYYGEHDEDAVTGDIAYFRVGGHIQGVSGNRSAKLNEKVYGTAVAISAKGRAGINSGYMVIGGERLNAFAPHVEKYIYQDGARAKDTISGYTIYHVNPSRYLSDMPIAEKTAEVSLDKDFSGSLITMRGRDYWSPSETYDKGIVLKGGSAVYDLTGMEDYVFSAVVGKNDFDWRKMGGGFDRNMFDAESTLVIELDGKEVYRKEHIGMRSGNEEIMLDTNGAKTMKITVTGSGKSAKYEDAVLANAAFIPRGPIVVDFEKKDGFAEITVFNTDKEEVDIVLSSEDGKKVVTKTGRIGKGLYETISIEAGKNAKVQAVITGKGTVVLE